MTINEFLSLYKQAFGEDAPLPVALVPYARFAMEERLRFR